VNRKRTGGSELRNVFIFLGVLLILLVGSFFVGMYLGTETPEQPAIIDASGEKRPLVETETSAEEEPGAALSGQPSSPGGAREPEPEIGEPPHETDPGIGQPSGRDAATDKAAAEMPVYSVQVGAFRDSGKAAERVARLKKKGYEAYIVPPAPSDSKALTKVRIGHFSKREEADALSRKIRQREGIQAFVTYR